MRHKIICLNYCRVENLRSDFTDLKVRNYPLCSNQTIFVNHKFRPPKKADKKKREEVKFLISEGFLLQNIYRDGRPEKYLKSSSNYIGYPATMKETKGFVIKYKTQSLKK